MNLRDLEKLLTLQKTMEQRKEQIQRLRESVGVKAANISGMPSSAGPQDKIGDTVPDIVDAEEELRQLEKDHWVLWLQVLDWINGIQELDVQLILSLRYLDGMKWDQVAEKCKMNERAARRKVNLYLMKHDVDEDVTVTKSVNTDRYQGKGHGDNGRHDGLYNTGVGKAYENHS